ncbi:unnamed protein product, partial [Urochloa humidicola]
VHAELEFPTPGNPGTGHFLQYVGSAIRTGIVFFYHPPRYRILSVQIQNRVQVPSTGLRATAQPSLDKKISSLSPLSFDRDTGWPLSPSFSSGGGGRLQIRRPRHAQGPRCRDPASTSCAEPALCRSGVPAVLRARTIEIPLPRRALGPGSTTRSGQRRRSGPRRGATNGSRSGRISVVVEMQHRRGLAVPRGMLAITERHRTVPRRGWKGGDALQLCRHHQLAGAAESRRSGGVAMAERLDAR